MPTPGPWSIYKGVDAKEILDSGWALIVHGGNGGNIIANVNVKGGPDYTDRMPAMANARLIAAAPLLRQALADLVEWSAIMGGWDSPCWDRARAALDATREGKEDLPDDADQLRAEDRARRRGARCRHRPGDPDCECHPENDDEES